MKSRIRSAVGVTVLSVLLGCGQVPPLSAPSSSAATPTAAGTPAASAPTPSGTPSAARSSASPSSASPSASPSSASPSSASPSSASPSSASPSRAAKPPSLRGDKRNTWAFASLKNPSDIVVEGSTSRREAFSTSKVLVVAAFLETKAKGDPRKVSKANQKLIKAALTRSDGDAVIALQRQVPDASRVMTRLLRGVGDKTTVVPTRLLGLMPWSVRNQVRFMAALAGGKVVSKRASAYLLEQLKPIKEHAWGLGRIGATSYKGGWLRQGRVTRQMGVVDGYVVAVMTDAVGPVVRQTDGDSAHVKQLDYLAGRLKQRLAYERSRR